MVQLIRPRATAHLHARSTKKEKQELRQSLNNTRALIQQAYGCFNATSDTDLIESYVFEINALEARYNYLLRRLKELEGVS